MSEGRDLTGSTPGAILDAYDLEVGALADFCRVVEGLIRNLLDARGLRVHKVEARVKARESVEKKILKAGSDKYESLADITDLAGVRVITHFHDEVDHVAEMIETEFEIDRENSEDKRVLEPDRFGYLSLHYVAALTPQSWV